MIEVRQSRVHNVGGFADANVGPWRSKTVAHLDQLVGESFEHRQGMPSQHHTKRRLRGDVPQGRCRVSGLVRDGDDQALAVFRDPKTGAGLAEHAALDGGADTAPSLLASMLLGLDPSESTLDIVEWETGFRSHGMPNRISLGSATKALRVHTLPRCDSGTGGREAREPGTCFRRTGDQNTVTP